MPKRRRLCKDSEEEEKTSSSRQQNLLACLFDDDRLGGAGRAWFSVLDLWRLRPVCRDLRDLCAEALSALPRPVWFGATRVVYSDPLLGRCGCAGALDLSTLALVSWRSPDVARWASWDITAAIKESDAYANDPKRYRKDWDQMQADALAREGYIRCTPTAEAHERAVALDWYRRVFPERASPLRPPESVDGARPPAGLPPLPAGRGKACCCARRDGSLIVAGGAIEARRCGPLDALAKSTATALRWTPGAPRWESLPPMTTAREGAMSVALPDGRVLVAGGISWRRRRRTSMDSESVDSDDSDYFPLDEDITMASAEVLAADDAGGWSAVAPMREPRSFAAVGLLPSGHVIVSGGRGPPIDDPYWYLSGPRPQPHLATAELWDPVENTWTALPPMTQCRAYPACCTLSGGRFAVVGGKDDRGYDLDTMEIFDPVAGSWSCTRSPTSFPRRHDRSETDALFKRSGGGAVAIPGGMVVMGGFAGSTDGIQPCHLWGTNEIWSFNRTFQLYDECSDHWFTLPHLLKRGREIQWPLVQTVTQSPAGCTS